MRILVVATLYDRSEAAIFAALPALGLPTELICDPGGRDQDALRHAGVTISHLRTRHRLDRNAIRHVRERIRARRPDVIYAPRNSTLSVSLVASRRTDVRVVGYRGTIGHLSRLDPASWLTYLHPRIARIVCVSDAVRRYLLSLGLPESRCATVYKGHDPDWYRFAPPSRKPFGLSDGDFVLAFTGNVRPVKGIDVLFDAMRRLEPDSPARLWLIGEVRNRGIRRAAARPDTASRIVLAGFRKDAAELVSAADAYVMPSVAREGLPRGVIEAMCQSKPPIVTDVGGMPELVRHQESGLVVPPRDPNALAAAIAALARDPALRGRLGAAARRRIAETFHIRQTIEQMANLFRSIT